MTEEEQEEKTFETPEQTESEIALQQMYQTYPYTNAQAIYNAPKFLHDVAESKDTTKTGNVTEEELGIAPFTVRMLKDVQTYCMMMGLKYHANYFGDKSEIITASSLSKEGFLDKLVISTKQELQAITKSRKENKGWFKKKKSQQPEVTSLDQ